MWKGYVIGGVLVLGVVLLVLNWGEPETESPQMPSFKSTEPPKQRAPSSVEPAKNIPNIPFGGGRPDLGKTR